MVLVAARQGLSGARRMMSEIVRLVFGPRYPLDGSVIEQFHLGHCEFDPSYGPYVEELERDFDCGPVAQSLAGVDISGVMPRFLGAELLGILRNPQDQLQNSYLYMVCLGFATVSEDPRYHSSIWIYDELTPLECLVVLSVLCRVIMKAGFPRGSLEGSREWKTWFHWLHERSLEESGRKRLADRLLERILERVDRLVESWWIDQRNADLT